MRSEPQGGDEVDTLELSEPVRLLGVEVCDADILEDPTNWTSVNAVARIRTREGVEGYVPMAALFRRPFTPKTDSMDLELGFGLIGRIFKRAVNGHLSPEGCEQSPSYRTIQGPALFSCSAMGTLCDSFENPLCQGCFDAQDSNSQACADKFQECLDNLPQEESPKFCSDASASWSECLYEDLDGQPSILCEGFIEPGESKTVLRKDDYLCGELPVGTTHVGCEFDEDSKRLFFWNLWDATHTMSAGRLSSQKDTTSDAVTNLTDFSSPVDVPRVMSAGNFWLHVAPQPPALRINACILVPKMKLFGPSVEYLWYRTPAGGVIQAIDWGTYNLDHTVLCATGTMSIVSTEDGLRPQLLWDQITEMNTVLDSVDGLEIHLSMWGTFLVLNGFNVLPALSPSFRSVIADLIGNNPSLVTDPLLASGSVRKLITSFVLEMDEVVKAKEMLKKRLNQISADFAASDAANLTVQLENMCQRLIPTLDEGDPLFWPMQFIAMHCQAVADNPGLVAFVPNPESQTRLCYYDRYKWSPGDAPDLDDPGDITLEPTPWWARYAGQSWLRPGETDEGCRLGFRLRGDLDRAVWPILRCALGETNDWLNNGRPGGNAGLSGRIAQACTPEGLAAFEDLYGTPQQIADDLAGRVEVIACGF